MELCSFKKDTPQEKMKKVGKMNLKDKCFFLKVVLEQNISKLEYLKIDKNSRLFLLDIKIDAPNFVLITIYSGKTKKNTLIKNLKN